MQDRLPVAVIGMGGFGRATLEALLSSDVVRVVALGDRDRLTAERAGEDFNVPAFTDNRRLIIEAAPAVVYLAVPPAAAPGKKRSGTSSKMGESTSRHRVV